MHTPEPSSADNHHRATYAELLALSDERVMQELQAGNTDAFAVVFKGPRRSPANLTAVSVLVDVRRIHLGFEGVDEETSLKRSWNRFVHRRGAMEVEKIMEIWLS